jgi:hypothetical protein
MKINLQDPVKLLEKNQAGIQSFIEKTHQLRAEIDSFCSDDAVFSGQGASAMKAYLKEVHGSILLGWADCLTLYLSILNSYVSGLTNIERANAIISDEYITAYSETVDKVSASFIEDDADVANFYLQYQEFLFFT